MSNYIKYKVTLEAWSRQGQSLSGPISYEIEAGSEDAAVDVGFDQAFAEYPQWGTFRVMAVEEIEESTP